MAIPRLRCSGHQEENGWVSDFRDWPEIFKQIETRLAPLMAYDADIGTSLGGGAGTVSSLPLSMLRRRWRRHEEWYEPPTSARTSLSSIGT